MTTEELTKIRKHLHKHPELSGDEYNTQAFVKTQLKELGIKEVLEVGKTGLAVFFRSKNPGKKVMLRADMDALPIKETNTFEYKSIYPEVSHKCGHDGHTTIMLGLAAQLHKQENSCGEVCLIFQPAEENGRGAQQILSDENFDFDADMVFALHNVPAYPKHTIVCRKGSFTPAVKSVIFKLNGKTSHAAEPEKGINPGLAIAEILHLSKTLTVDNLDRDDFALITMVHVNMGEKAYGISAGYGEVHFTIRTWTNNVMDNLTDRLLDSANSIADKHLLEISEEWLEVFEANENDEAAVEIVKASAQELGLEYEDRKTPFKWGEDFGLYTQKYRGLMFGLGAGLDCPALHNPDYDYPDEITKTGIDMFNSILKHALK
jgi:amidohydrolase